MTSERHSLDRPLPTPHLHLRPSYCWPSRHFRMWFGDAIGRASPPTKLLLPHLPPSHQMLQHQVLFRPSEMNKFWHLGSGARVWAQLHFLAHWARSRLLGCLGSTVVETRSFVSRAPLAVAWSRVTPRLIAASRDWQVPYSTHSSICVPLRVDASIS
jgi:hypothetical protein